MKYTGIPCAHSNVGSTGYFRMFETSLAKQVMGFCGVLFPQNCLKVSEIFLQSLRWQQLGGCLPALQPSVGAPWGKWAPRPSRSTGGKRPRTPSLPRRTCRFAGLYGRGLNSGPTAEARGSGSDQGRPGRAAQRTWARRQVGPRGLDGDPPSRRGGAAGLGRPRGRNEGQVLGARRAASSHRAGAAATRCGMSFTRKKGSTSRTSTRPPGSCPRPTCP